MYVHEVLVNRLGGLCLAWKSVFRIHVTDRPDMTVDVYRGLKTICWLVGWFFGLNDPLRQYFSPYRAVSQTEREKGKRNDKRE